MNEFCRVYGEALYELCAEENLQSQVLSQMKNVCTVFDENPSYLQLVGNASIAMSERLSLLGEAFEGRAEVPLVNFMKLLCERGALSQFAGCTKVYEHLYNEANGIEPVVVTSAMPLTEDQQQRLCRVLGEKTGKTIQLTVRVDPAVRGGLRCEMAGKRFDNTIETRMDTLRRVLSEKS